MAIGDKATAIQTTEKFLNNYPHLSLNMKDYHINIFYSEDERGYIADIPDLKLCSAWGSTPEEALREVILAKAVWLETATAQGKSKLWRL